VGTDRDRRLRRVLARLALFLAVGASYFAIGVAFLDTDVFLDATDLFDVDIRRVVHDIARRDAFHYRTKVHPLFVLLFNPLGLALKHWLVRPRLAATLLTASAGALSVVLFLELVTRLGVARGRAALWTAVFALSASQVFFGVFPETFAFSAASLLLVFVVFAGERPSRAATFLASLVSFGVTTVNLGAAFFLALFRQPPHTAPRKALGRATGFALAVLAAAVALSLAQKAYSSMTEVFFLPSSFAEETSYTFLPRDVGSALARAGDLGRSVLFTSLAAPCLAVQRPSGAPPVVRFDGWDLRSVAHGIVWTGLLLAGAGAWQRREWRRRPLIRALALWLACNVVLYSFYGQTFFLYSSQWTFAVLALAASALEDVLVDRWRSLASLALLATASLQLWADGRLLLEIHRLYR
jgi:hypothetical protein